MSKKEAIELMQKHGWKLNGTTSGDNFAMIKKYTQADIKNVKAFLFPNHFEPVSEYRYVFITKSHNGGYYATSDIKGVYRGYRCRLKGEDYRGNIFGCGATWEEVVTDFLHDVDNLLYNRKGKQVKGQYSN